jgi:pilus assembly protein CpaE
MQAMRVGVTEYLPKPVSSEDLSAALDRTARKMGLSLDGAAPVAGKLFVAFGVKGGSGTTTVATNLAIRLHQLTGKKTLLVDLNLDLGEVALFLGMQPRYTFVDLFRNLHRMDAELLTSYIEQHDSGVHLLASPQDPGMADAITADEVHRILGLLRQHYHYVVVDTSTSLAPITMAALEQADEALLIANADLPSLRNIKRVLPFLERMAGRPKDRIRLVVNRFQEDDLIPLKDVQSTLEIEAYSTLANDYESVIRSINSGKPVALDRKSKFNSDLGALSTLIVGAGAAAKDSRKGPFGSIKKLFGLKKDQGAAHE